MAFKTSQSAGNINDCPANLPPKNSSQNAQEGHPEGGGVTSPRMIAKKVSRRESLAHLLLTRNQKANWNHLRQTLPWLPEYWMASVFLRFAITIEIKGGPVSPHEAYSPGRANGHRQHSAMQNVVKYNLLTVSGRYPRKFDFSEAGRMVWEKYLAMLAQDIANIDKIIASL